MSLPRCSVFIAMSLDGYIATPENGLEWLDIAQSPDGEDYGYAEFMASVDALILGRNTYDVVSKFPDWPYKEKKVFVLTHRPLKPLHNEVSVSGSIKSILEKLEKDGIKNVYLDGGKTIQTGLQEKVVDDLTVSVLPILLGKGISLFGDLPAHMKLQNTSALAYPSGLVQLKYETPSFHP
ncbi:Dihydrofolate reductase [compost metagenome]